jgi:hypothetical protein
MMRDQVSTGGVRRRGADFLRKSSAFSGGVWSYVVSMNNESPSINLRAERKKFYEDINTVVLGIQYVAFWKGVE